MTEWTSLEATRSSLTSPVEARDIPTEPAPGCKGLEIFLEEIAAAAEKQNLALAQSVGRQAEGSEGPTAGSGPFLLNQLLRKSAPIGRDHSGEKPETVTALNQD